MQTVVGSECVRQGMWQLKWRGGGDGNKHTFGSSREASVPGLRFLRSEKTPSSNFFMLTTGRPNASKRNTRARTMSVPVMW